MRELNREMVVVVMRKERKWILDFEFWIFSERKSHSILNPRDGQHGRKWKSGSNTIQYVIILP